MAQTQTNSFQFSLAPFKLSDLPAEETLITAAQRLMESTLTWKQGKTYHKVIKTYQSTQPTAASDGGLASSLQWHCRVSEHTPEEATFEQFWEKLGKNKAVNEKEFIPEIKEVKKVKEVSSTAQIWTLYYTFTPPVSPRVFTELQVVYLDEGSGDSPKTGLVISLPIDLSSDPELAKTERKGVKGRYVSVERLLALENGNTEWRMATASTPGGMIPNFVVESTMDSTIAKDVPHFLSWLHKLSK